MPERTETPEAPEPHADIGTVVWNIAGKIAGDGYGRGNLAALRRLDPDKPNAAAFWSMMAEYNDAALDREDDIRRWALIVKGMALMVPHHYRPKVEPGRVLAQVDYSEARLNRLLNAQGGQFRDQFLRLCRFLAAKAEPVDWRLLARLALAEGRSEDRAQQHRMRIARSYYRALNAKQAAA